MPALAFRSRTVRHAGKDLIVDMPDNVVLKPDVELSLDPAYVNFALAGGFLSTTAVEPFARHTFDLGKPADVEVFCGGHRYCPWWMKPAVGRDLETMPAETQFLLMRRKNGAYLLVLSMVDGPMRTALLGGPGNHLHATAQSGDPGVTSEAVTLAYVITGDDPYLMMRAAAERITERMGTGRLQQDKAIPRSLDLFGWCTWDAFYQEVSHENVRKGLASFRKIGVEPRFMILDDGWQQVRAISEDGVQRVVTGFDANDKFPRGLRDTIRLAREEFLVDQFYVWHAVQGYWSGVDSERLPKYQSRMTRKQWSPEIEAVRPGITETDVPAEIVPPDRAFLFFNDYYRHLSQQGVDGVKVDSQCVLEACAAGHGGRAALMQAYHDAFEAAAELHFGGNVINCMCGSNDALYAMSRSNVARSSDDYYPSKPETHGLHVWFNAINGYYIGEFAIPDWDMFQSAGEFGAFHAMARAVSGGPVYVSDKPGEHNAELLRKLVFSDGTVPVCVETARPTLDSLFVDPTRDDALLKVFNFNEATAVVGLFNCHANEAAGGDGASITGKLSPADLPLPGWSSQHAAIYLHNQQRLAIMQWAERMDVTLAPLTAEVATIAPVVGGLAVIGLIDKYNSGGTFTYAQGEDDEVALVVDDAGVLLVYCAAQPRRVLVNGEPGSFTYDAEAGSLLVDLTEGEEVEDMPYFEVVLVPAG